MNSAHDSFDRRPNPAGSKDQSLSDDNATRYTGTAAPAPADPEATSYKQTPPPDPESTRYGPATVRGQSFEPRRVGNYELLEELARGGMGVVYRARQVSPPRPVALKMLLAGAFATREAIERFSVEAKATANLDHPGIVPIIEFGALEGKPFLSMPFIGGGSLQQLLIAGPLPPAQAAALVKQVAEATHYAHERGIIHRDIKPGNILLQSDEAKPTAEGSSVPKEGIGSSPTHPSKSPIPRLTDFGLARLAQEGSGLTAPGETMGTPSYMPPEQATGHLEAIGPASDVYSLGAVLYCCLTGRPPFQTASVVETLRQVREEEPLRPRQLNTGVPRDLETVCLKCLAKETGRRYGSAAELAADLGRLLRGEPVHARPIGRLERGWRWAKREPKLAAALVVTGCLLIVLVTALALFAHEQADNAQRQAELRGNADQEASKAREAEKKAKGEAQRADGEASKARLAEKEAKSSEAQKDKQLTRAEWLLYIGQITGARRAWETGNFDTAYDLLDACRWDFRGWEHNYLYTLIKNRRSAWSPLYSVAFSPDGKRLVSGSVDQTLKVWDAVTGREIFTLKGYAGRGSLAFSPDAKRLVSGGLDNSVKVLDAATGQETLTLKGHTGVVTSVAFSPDGKRLLSGGYDQTLKLWDATTGQETLTLKGHTSAVKSVAFSPDGKRLVSGSEDNTVKVWDAVTGRETLTFKGYAGSGNLAFSPEGKRLISGSNNGTIKIWDATTGQEIITLKGHGHAVHVTFSPDGKRFASGGELASDTHLAAKPPATEDRVTFRVSAMTVKVWDAASYQQLLTLKGIEAVGSLAFSPGGKLLVSGSGNDLKVWILPDDNSSAAREQVPAQNPAKAEYGMTNCSLWRQKPSEKDQSDSIFVKEDKGWVEIQGGKIRARFEEKHRVAQYIELYDPGQAVSVCLYPDKILHKQPRADWVLLPAKCQASQEGTIKPPDDGRQMTDCTLWRYKSEMKGGMDGYFLKTDKSWLEIQGDRIHARFEEKNRIAEYVELYDGGRDLTLRLYPDKILWKQARTEWLLLPAQGRASQELAILPPKP